MKLKSLFKRRNYIYIYNLIRPYSFVNPFSGNFTNFQNLDELISYFEIKKYSKIAIVASGPSSKELKRDASCLYFCCNDSIKLMHGLDYIYMLQDPYYLMRYLKTFKENKNWKGTIFWFYYSKSSNNLYRKIVNYLRSKSRSKGEFLITNNAENPSQFLIYNEIRSILRNDLNYTHFGVNSGFNTLVFATVIAYYCKLPLEIYGLDAGVGGDRYFNKNSELGLNIKKEETKLKISEFLSSCKALDIEVNNLSYFKQGRY